MMHRSESSRGSLLLFVILVAAACDGTSPDDALSNVSGTWDARFEGTVDGSGFSQNDAFTLELVQSGSSVTGTLRFVGLSMDFQLSGTVTESLALIFSPRNSPLDRQDETFRRKTPFRNEGRVKQLVSR